LQLEKRLEEHKRKQETSNQSEMTNGYDSDFKPRILQRPKNQPPSQPNPIKILKRPDSNSSLSSSSSLQQNNSNKPVVKTLEQREKEYAEARKRILGTSECITNEQPR
jgi:hypothetical protein